MWEVTMAAKYHMQGLGRRGCYVIRLPKEVEIV
jgi:hypothetical protein